MTIADAADNDKFIFVGVSELSQEDVGEPLKKLLLAPVGAGSKGSL